MNSGRALASPWRSQFQQGQWDEQLIDQALSHAITTGQPSHWVDYLDVCQAIRKMKVSEWQCVANTVAARSLSSPKLRLKLAQLLLLPCTAQHISKTERKLLLHSIYSPPEEKLCAVAIDTLHSGYLGTRVSHYPGLLTCEDLAISITPIFGYMLPRHRLAARRLMALKTPFDVMMEDALSAHAPGRSATPNDRPAIAVVGNSPAILHENKGTEIDSADLVVRFNNARMDKSKYTHTGTRTDIWVTSPSTKLTFCPPDATSVVVSGHNALTRPSFFWRHLPALNRPLSEFPQSIWHTLVSRFNAPPSAGTLLLASLDAMVMDVDIRCYGFTSYQDDLTALPNHHVDNKPRSTRHNWQAEIQWLASRLN